MHSDLSLRDVPQQKNICSFHGILNFIFCLYEMLDCPSVFSSFLRAIFRHQSMQACFGLNKGDDCVLLNTVISSGYILLLLLLIFCVH